MRVLFKSFAILFLIFPLGLAKSQALQKAIVSEKDFNICFPLRSQFYTYDAFAKAISEISILKIKIEKRGDWIYKITRTDKRANTTTVIRQDKDWNEAWAQAKPYSSIDVDYRDFCANKESNIDKKELAAFFAHIAHETRNGINNKFNDGLMLISEANTNLDYITENVVYPAVAGKKYYGRGPLQLSYNGNYGFASECIFGDKNILLNNPDLVSLNPILAFETAIYFWMTPQALKPSAHNVMTGSWKPTPADKQNGYTSGFGLTINIINGKLECNKGENILPMLDRIGFYRYFLKKFKMNDVNCACSCAQMASF